MDLSQIALLLIATIPTIGLIASSKWLKVLDKKFFWIYLIFALFCFVYFIAGRFGFDIANFIEHYGTTTSEYDKSVLASKVMLLDLCPLVAFLLPLLAFIDKKRIFAKWLSPVTIIGSLITIYGQIIWEKPNDLFTYIFLGEGSNKLYFMMHFLSLLLAIWTLIISTKFKMWELPVVFLCMAVWLGYVLIMVNAFNITTNATGLVEYDWLYGQYNKVYEFFKLPFPWIVVFWYSIAVFGIYFIISIQSGFLVKMAKKTKNLFKKKEYINI
ncbi:MAG: DUF5378 family protein [Mycoplasma sp.]